MADAAGISAVQVVYQLLTVTAYGLPTDISGVEDSDVSSMIIRALSLIYQITSRGVCWSHSSNVLDSAEVSSKSLKLGESSLFRLRPIAVLAAKHCRRRGGRQKARRRPAGHILTIISLRTLLFRPVMSNNNLSGYLELVSSQWNCFVALAKSTTRSSFVLAFPRRPCWGYRPPPCRTLSSSLCL